MGTRNRKISCKKKYSRKYKNKSNLKCKNTKRNMRRTQKGG